MPEGHTLHRLARDLNETFGRKRIRSSTPQGRFGDALELDGQILHRAEAVGKHLLVEFSGTPRVVHIHLGLYGSLRFAAADAPVVGQVRWRLSHRTAVADLRGPTRCELADPADVEALMARLGPDPLRADARPDDFVHAVTRSRVTIGSLLMDQRIIAGVGNVYRAEVLFRAGLDPQLRGADLAPEEVRWLWDDLVELMEVGVERNRIDTVRPEHEPEVMGRPPRQDDHGGEVYIYRRAGQPCHVCGTPIETEVMQGRNLFWCPNCQSSK